MAPRAAWKVLGLPADSDVPAIRRAYADRLRAMDPDADPAAFDRLRAAREVALAIARRSAEAPAVPIGTPEDEADRTVPLPLATFAAPVLDTAEPLGPVSVAPPPAATPQPLTPPPAEANAGTLDAALPRASLTAAPVEAAPTTGTLGVTAADAYAAVDAAYERIVALLLPNGEPSDYALSDEEQAEIDAALDTVAADPRLEELGFHARAEQWLAAVLADAIPRSDSVLHRVVDLFGWRDRAGRIGEEPAIERVVDRARTLTFVTAVQNPDHRYHAAWAELSNALPERRWYPWRANRRQQRELLEQVRRNLPDLEAWLDPARVAKVENQVSGPGIPYWAMGLIAAALLRLCSAIVPETPPVDGNSVSVPVMAAGESEPLRSRDADLDVGLLDIADGFTASKVRLENPALFLELDRLWRDADARGERIEPFRRQVATYLSGQLRRGIQQAAYADIAAYRRLDQVTLRKLGELDPNQCATANKTDPALTLTDAERQQKRALHARMLMTVKPGMTPADRYTFSVPGEAMAAIMDATRLPRPAVSKALNNTGDPATICRVRAALIDAALDLPRKKGLALLREM